ncbi:MAG: flavodoxin family protein [Methanoregula sp.]|jgi:hypothetical protein|nr:flavodoxin family protein [Methanoregula sp.]
MAGTVLGILGSPLPEGNTAKLLDMALKGAADAGCTTEKIVLANLDFQSCTEMMFCKEHNTCIMDDDMQQLYKQIQNADSIILASPIMTMGLPGKLKSFMDRCQVFFMAKYVRKTPLVTPEKKKIRCGLFICISGMKIPEVFIGANLTAKAWFDIIDCTYSGDLLINDMDTILDITRRQDLLDAAYAQGNAIGKSLNS